MDRMQRLQRKWILIGLILWLTETVMAQTQTETVNDSILLQEVVVQGARVVNKADGKWIFPTNRQKESSPNTFSLLGKLTLPHIKVDEVQHTLSAPELLGDVQVRVDGILAEKDDLLSLDMQNVDHVEYISNPGVRYGQDVGFVINIVTRRAESGWLTGADLTQTVTAMNGSYNLFAKWNQGKSEWTAGYALSQHDLYGFRFEEKATYQMSNGDVWQMGQNDLSRRMNVVSHHLQLKYNIADSNRYVAQVELSGELKRTPHDDILRVVQQNELLHEVTITSDDRSASPVLDLYGYYRFPRHQSLTANVVGTFIHGDYTYLYKGIGGDDYHYSILGDTWLLNSEVIYENVLRPFTWLMGCQYRQSFLCNNYDGDVLTTDRVRSNNEYLFSELKGRWGRLSYVAGLGLDRQEYLQHTYWMVSPKLTLSYLLGEKWKFRYNLTLTHKKPRPSKISEAMVRTNEMEFTAGNPSLKPTRRLEQQAQLSFQHQAFHAELSALYRRNTHVDMMKIVRGYNGDRECFITTYANQKGCHMLLIDENTTWDLVPDKLSLMLNGSLFRSFNYGDDYQHHYTSWMGGFDVVAYLKNLTLKGHADNGWRFLEGEHQGRQGGAYYISASYHTKNLTVSVFWQHFLNSCVTPDQSVLLNQWVWKKQLWTSSDYANMLTLNLTWRLSKGRKAKHMEKTMNLREYDDGMIKHDDAGK